jgi:voltage-gated potassium channel
VTSEGRLLGVLLMTPGIGLLGAFSGFVASWFLAPIAKGNRSEIEMLREEIRELRELVEVGVNGAASQAGPPRRRGRRTPGP